MPKSKGLTPMGVTALTPALVTHSAPSPIALPTKKRAYKPRARKCKQCAEAFTPQRKGADYCGAACRQAAYRKRQSKAVKAQPKAKPAVAPFVCEHCRKASWQPVVKDRRYCSATCRVGACAVRKEAAIAALALTIGDYDKAAVSVENLGMRVTRAALASMGLQYDVAARQWVKGSE